MKYIIFPLLLMATGLLAQAPKLDAALATKSVSVFKNGTAFFIKEGEVPTKDQQYVMTENLPRALFGTFWIHSPVGQLKHLSSYSDIVTTETEDMARSFVDLLEANKGKRMRITIGGGEVHEGSPEEVVMKDAKGEERSFVNTTIVVFRTADSWLSFSPAEIKRIEFLEKPEQVIKRSTHQSKNVLAVDFRNDKKKQPLEMMYLQNGINWTPTYLIELVSDDKARLSLRAEVSNNAEDIKDTDMNFVVGIPNFRFANRLSVLVDFLGMIHASAPNYALNNFSNSLSTQQLGYEMEDLGLSAPGTGMSQGVVGDADEDLYFYQVEGVSIKNGGRGQYPIFSEDIDVAHIYECNLQQNPTTSNTYQKEYLFQPDNQNPVFHSLKVENNLEYPWTTGSAMVVSRKSGQKRPISQDMLNYTPIKGHSYVKLTESPDIKVKHAEKEVSREQKAKPVPGQGRYYYDYVTVEGQIKVRSYKDKAVDLNIKRVIHGDLAKSDVKWLKAEQVNRSGSYNKINDVCWETSIRPGEELEINYTYKVYLQQYY